MLKGSLVSQRLTRSLPIFERFLALIIPPPFVGHYTIRDIRYNGLISLPPPLRYFFGVYFLFFFPLHSNRHRSELSLLRQVRLRSAYHRQNIPVTSLTSSSMSRAAFEPPFSCAATTSIPLCPSRYSGVVSKTTAIFSTTSYFVGLRVPNS